MLTRLEISSEELRKLNYERYHYPCPYSKKITQHLYKSGERMSNEGVGKLTDAHRNSISEWVQLISRVA